MEKDIEPLMGEYIFKPCPERLKMAFDFLADIILEKNNEKQKIGKNNRSFKESSEKLSEGFIA